MRIESKTVREAVAKLYAAMATKAAQKAVDKIGYDKCHEAEAYAEWATKWLIKSSAEAVKWSYHHPRTS